MPDFVATASSNKVKLYEVWSNKSELKENPLDRVIISGVVLPLSTVTLIVAIGAVVEYGV